MTHKLKDVLYYALRGGYRSDYTVIAVTSFKPSGRWFGRIDATNETTHGTRRDLHGKFNSAVVAAEYVERVKQIKRLHGPKIQAASDALSQAHRDEDRDLKELLDGATITYNMAFPPSVQS